MPRPSSSSDLEIRKCLCPAKGSLDNLNGEIIVIKSDIARNVFRCEQDILMVCQYFYDIKITNAVQLRIRPKISE